MKKTTYTLVLLFIICFSSACQRKYTCSCTSDIDGSIVNESQYKLTKADAESSCSNFDKAVDTTCVLTKGH